MATSCLWSEIPLLIEFMPKSITSSDLAQWKSYYCGEWPYIYWSVTGQINT